MFGLLAHIVFVFNTVQSLQRHTRPGSREAACPVLWALEQVAWVQTVGRPLASQEPLSELLTLPGLYFLLL